MSKLTEVEAALIRIEPTKFQQFGDDYLYYAEAGSPDIQRFGTQKGKMKSKKGHPDSYYWAAEGKYVFIEYTTQARDPSGEAFLEKIKRDLIDCWNEKKTKVPRNQIERIIYCCNSNLSPELELRLNDFVQSEGIPLAIADFKTLDTLSREVVNRYPWLAKNLELKIDTEQMLPIRTFVKQYQASSFATPLTMPMAGRGKEIAELRRAMKQYRITLVTGAPGTGKTRLVLGVLEELQQAGSMKVICLSDKQRPIYDDLCTYLVGTTPYVLFLDDGNYRIEFLQQILHHLKERPESLCLVITVRNTGLERVQEVCRDYESTTIPIGILDDDIIRTILGGDPFNITNRFAMDQILSIANGNPRLAVMAAQVALEDNSMERLLDVSQLYHTYFGRFIDASVQKNATMVRVLGLLSLFRTIDIADTVFCSRLFEVVGLDANTFGEACRQLAQFELVDAYFTGNSFRMSEQTLGAYFFYRAVIEESLLDMGGLFREFFSSDTERFKEMISGVYNTFGQEKGIATILPAMSGYWMSIKNDESLAIRYLDAFWYCQRDELLLFVEQKVEKMLITPGSSFDYAAKSTPSPLNSGNAWLGLLANAYPYNVPELGEFVGLSITFVCKVPGEYPGLIANFKQAFPLRPEDESSGFNRQRMLLKVLEEQGTENEMSVRTFLKLASALLRTNRQFSSWGRKMDIVHIHRAQYRLSEDLKTLRDSVWKYILTLPLKYIPFIPEFLNEYQIGVQEAEPAIVVYDNQYILQFFRRVYSTDKFGDCCAVQQWIKTLSGLEISDPAIDAVKQSYWHPTYQLYTVLHWDILDGVEQHELAHSPHEMQVFYQLKEKEIRAACAFSNFGEFKSFLEQYSVIREWEARQQQNWTVPALDIAIEEMMKNDELGLAGIQLIIDSDNPVGYVPFRPIQWLVEQKSWRTFEMLYRMVQGSTFPGQPQWIERLVGAIPIERLCAANIDDLVGAYGQGWKGYAADLDWSRFVAVDPSSPARLLSAIEASNRDRKGEIRLLPQWLEAMADRWLGDWTLLKATYLQQAQIASHFDATYSLLAKYVSHQPGFLAEYVEASTMDWRSVQDHRGLGILWTAPKAEQAMQEAFDYGLTEERCNLTKMFYPELFRRVPEQEQQRAFAFLCQYIAKNKEEVEKVDVVLECVREGMPGRLESIVHFLLSVQPHASFFESLRWTRDHYTLGRGRLVSEMKAAEFQVLLDILERMPGKHHRYAEHRAFLLRQIDEWKKRAAFERKRRFLDEDL